MDRTPEMKLIKNLFEYIKRKIMLDEDGKKRSHS
jgi:hypothetical protein